MSRSGLRVVVFMEVAEEEKLAVDNNGLSCLP